MPDTAPPTPLTRKAWPAWARLARALGVTRVARVTALDRSGVEVACAIRPGGHVLQVTNGKGFDRTAAAAGAILEAAELACAERIAPAGLRWASEAELREARAAFLSAAELGGRAASGPVAWRDARDLFTGEPLWVPAAAVHVPPPGGPLLGLAAVRWTSNGMGAHPSWPAALLHALLEAIERDQLARALPDGWNEAEVARRRLDPAALRRAAPGLARRVARVERGGLAVHLFDLAPEGGLGLPVAGALLFDRARGPVPLTAGYACRLEPTAALQAALLEAAQSRLTDIHGAREDVVGMSERDVERLRRACAATDPDRDRRGRSWKRTVSPEPFDSARGRAARYAQGRLRAAGGGAESKGRDPDLDRSLHRVLTSLHAAGHTRCAALDLAPPDLGVHVAKVLVPGLLLSELL